MVPVDSTLIAQVIINLLKNAVKYSPEASPVSISFCKFGKYVKITVHDNGCGIPEDLLGKQFESYAKANVNGADSIRSTGMGLSICKTIVTAHGGLIEGHNNIDKGAEFSFMLPLKEGENSEYDYAENINY